MENEKLETLSRAKVRFRFKYKEIPAVFFSNEILSTILLFPFKPFVHSLSQSFVMDCNQKNKLNEQKFRAAIKETAVVKLAH